MATQAFLLTCSPNHLFLDGGGKRGSRLLSNLLTKLPARRDAFTDLGGNLGFLPQFPHYPKRDPLGKKPIISYIVSIPRPTEVFSPSRISVLALRSSSTPAPPSAPALGRPTRPRAGRVAASRCPFCAARSRRPNHFRYYDRQGASNENRNGLERCIFPGGRRHRHVPVERTRLGRSRSTAQPAQAAVTLSGSDAG